MNWKEVTPDKAGGGFNICHYKRGDCVRRLWPSKPADILDETPFMGSNQVIRYNACYHDVLLYVLQ